MKWFDKEVQLKINHLVLIKQQDLSLLHWLLGRIQEIHVGVDGIARSATVKTAKGVFIRPLIKLAILPIESSNPNP